MRNCCASPSLTVGNRDCFRDAFSLIEDENVEQTAGEIDVLQRAGLEVTQADRGRSFVASDSRLEERLQRRILSTVIPQLAQGLLDNRKDRLRVAAKPSDEELAEVFRASLVFLYRLLFVLYAESRELLPLIDANEFSVSFKEVRDEIAEQGGVTASEVADRLQRAYLETGTAIYDRLSQLFQSLAKHQRGLDIPACLGGLFPATPGSADDSLAEAKYRTGDGNRRRCSLPRSIAAGIKTGVLTIMGRSTFGFSVRFDQIPLLYCIGFVCRRATLRNDPQNAPEGIAGSIDRKRRWLQPSARFIWRAKKRAVNRPALITRRRRSSNIWSLTQSAPSWTKNCRPCGAKIRTKRENRHKKKGARRTCSIGSSTCG